MRTQGHRATRSHKKPIIAITTGDPNGIGPEVTEKALADRSIRKLADFIVMDTEDDTGFGAIKKAARLFANREAGGLVTAPVNKAAINKSGIPFKGHTEYLAEAAGVKRFAMMLCGGPLKVTIVTRHTPLKKVSSSLSKQSIIDATILTDSALKRHFGISRPRIGVCGLNPHCGEGGEIGDEEEKIIRPAVRSIKRALPGVRGPISGDAIFYMAYKGGLDAIISMYHDQGLGPLKMIAFEKGVNVTLGLPFVRTSPDHGTAYDIAGKGIANPSSMKEAIKLAAKMLS